MFLKQTLKWFFFLIFSLVICVAIAGYFFLNQLQAELPDIKQLNNVEYQIPLSIYSKDGLLLAQFGEKKTRAY